MKMDPLGAPRPRSASQWHHTFGPGALPPRRPLPALGEMVYKGMVKGRCWEQS